MIHSEPVLGTDRVTATFSVPRDGHVEPVAVVGDFNDWDATANLLAPSGDTCSASVVMGTGRRYAFRYLAGDGRWFNDHSADCYQPNEFGGSDSVVDLTGKAEMLIIPLCDEDHFDEAPAWGPIREPS